MIEVFFDGACVPNPGGIMAVGVVVYEDNIITKQIGSRYTSKFPVDATNNVAEYVAFLSALKYLQSVFYLNKPITFFGDSKLVIMQMRGDWQINDGAYKPFAERAKTLKDRFSNLSFQWIPRDKNVDADKLAWQAIFNLESKL